MVQSPSLPRTASSGNAIDVDDDGHPRRTGTVWTACVHILTSVMGSGVLILVWAMAQLGWIVGPAAMLLFSVVTWYAATLLADCYRSGDPVTGIRNCTYVKAVRSNLGGTKSKIFGLVYYSNIIGVAIGYAIASATSMTAIRRSDCFENDGVNYHPCHVHPSTNMIVFGGIQFILSQIPDFNQLWFLVVVAALTSLTYSTSGLVLSIKKIAETGELRGSLTGVSMVVVTETQKIWRSFQALGVIAFAFSFSGTFIEIQDTIKSPSEAEAMKKATVISIGGITLFYMLCSCFGYAAFGDSSPANLLVAFGLYNPSWLTDIANAALAIHLIGAYQVYCQPFFIFVEKAAADRFPDSEFITREYRVPIPRSRPYNLNLFRLVWRTIFVVITTVISMLFPFFKEKVSFLGAWGFWPLTVYFPVELYIGQKKIPKWSSKWVCLQILSFACLVITLTAAAGSIAGIFLHLSP